MNIVPTAIKQVAGRGGGYHKIMMNDDGTPKLDDDGNTIPARYEKGMHIGEIIKLSESKYEALSDEKKKAYRPNVRGTIRTVSFAEHFGSKKAERSALMSKLHDDYFEEVGKKWGFERGDVWALLSDEERWRRMHRTKEQAGLEREAREAARTAEKKRDAIIDEVAEQERVKVSNADFLKSQDKQIQEKGSELQHIKDDTEKAKTEAAAAVEVTKRAKAERDTAVKERNDSKAEVEQNEKTINNQVTAINKNKATIAKQEEAKAELEKSIDLMSRIENLTNQNVDSYVKDLEGIQIELNKNIRGKLISPLKNHPRIEYTNPPLTAEELERIALEEEAKVINKIGGILHESGNRL